jgi:hypothetical protein
LPSGPCACEVWHSISGPPIVKHFHRQKRHNPPFQEFHIGHGHRSAFHCVIPARTGGTTGLLHRFVIHWPEAESASKMPKSVSGQRTQTRLESSPSCPGPPQNPSHGTCHLGSRFAIRMHSLPSTGTVVRAGTCRSYDVGVGVGVGRHTSSRCTVATLTTPPRSPYNQLELMIEAGGVC